MLGASQIRLFTGVSELSISNMILEAGGALPFHLGLAVDSSGFGTWNNARNGYRYRKLRALNPVLERGIGRFDDAHVSIRDFCRVEDKFHALYAGHDGTRWQLGYLTLE